MNLKAVSDESVADPDCSSRTEVSQMSNLMSIGMRTERKRGLKGSGNF